MSGDCKEQPHIYYTEYGRKTLEEYYVNQIESLTEKVEQLERVIDYLESKVKTHHTIFTNYELSFINEELLVRLEALEEKVRKSNMLMRRPGHEEYEKLVDVVCDHEQRLQSKEQQPQSVVGGGLELSEIDDINW